MVCHVDLEAVATGKDAALFADTAVVGVGFASAVVATSRSSLIVLHI
ncbi:hypothetical protein [Neisseria yangbaofengii]|nr:hypothetical protein [Neisseria yangbaofengii]